MSDIYRLSEISDQEEKLSCAKRFFFLTARIDCYQTRRECRTLRSTTSRLFNPSINNYTHLRTTESVLICSLYKSKIWRWSPDSGIFFVLKNKALFVRVTKWSLYVVVILIFMKTAATHYRVFAFLSSATFTFLMCRWLQLFQSSPVQKGSSL